MYMYYSFLFSLLGEQISMIISLQSMVNVKIHVKILEIDFN